MAIGFIARFPALSGQFLWDDTYLARDNPFIKSPLLIPESFRHYLFLDPGCAHYRPVQNITYVFDYFLWSTNPFGFHLTNVLLHVLSGLLLYALLRKLLQPLLRNASSGLAIAFLVALLWIVHPVHSAAVDYISGRADSLAFLFCSAGWLLVLHAKDLTGRIYKQSFYYGAAGILGLLALCSRESAVIWFVLFLVYLFIVDKRVSLRFKLTAISCCLVIIAAFLSLRRLPGESESGTADSRWTAPSRAVLMLRALGDYGHLMFFPTSLHMERTVAQPMNYLSNSSWRDSITSEYLSLGGLFLSAALLYGAIRPGAGRSTRIFGSSWFLIGYLPISNIVDLNATVAEHWLYLPSVGFLIFLAGCALDLPVRYQKIACGVAGIAVICLTGRSIVRSGDWQTPETFFQRTIAAGGTTARAGVNLGLYYTEHHDYIKAEDLFRRVLNFAPDYPIALTSLADVLNRQGRKEEAEKILTSANAKSNEARKDYPVTWLAALNLSRLYARDNDKPGAIAILEKARHDYLGNWELTSFEAELEREIQGPDAALSLVADFAATHWWHYGASMALGRLYWEKGDLEKADSWFLHASRLDVHDTASLNEMARISLLRNHLEEAEALQKRAVARQPDEPHQYAMLSGILEKMGRIEEARAASLEVARLETLARAPEATP